MGQRDRAWAYIYAWRLMCIRETIWVIICVSACVWETGDVCVCACVRDRQPTYVHVCVRMWAELDWAGLSVVTTPPVSCQIVYVADTACTLMSLLLHTVVGRWAVVWRTNTALDLLGNRWQHRPTICAAESVYRRHLSDPDTRRHLQSTSHLTTHNRQYAVDISSISNTGR